MSSALASYKDKIVLNKMRGCVESFQYSTWHLVGIQKKYLCIYMLMGYSSHQFAQ